MVFSKGHYSNVNCVHVPSGLGQTQVCNLLIFFGIYNKLYILIDVFVNRKCKQKVQLFQQTKPDPINFDVYNTIYFPRNSTENC